jgi:hypothetical protein
MNGCIGKALGTVEIIRSNWLASRFIASVSLHKTASRAPSRFASAILPRPASPLRALARPAR